MTPSTGSKKQNRAVAPIALAVGMALLGQPLLALSQVYAPQTPFGGGTFGSDFPTAPGTFGSDFPTAPGTFGSSFPTVPAVPSAGRGGESSGAPTRQIAPYVTVLETLSSNVSLSATNRTADLISQITPGVRVFENGARVRLNGSLALQSLWYLNQSEFNRITPVVNLLGNAELVPRFFFLDGSVSTSRSFFSPLGPVSPGTGTAPQNQATTATYRISPYIQGVGWNNISYLLRNDNIWTNLSSAPVSTSNTYTNRVYARLASPVAPAGWSLEYDRNNVEFTAQSQSFLTQLGRARLLYNVDPTLQLSASGGYEQNNYFSGAGGQYSGSIYGAGFNWRPSPLTAVVGQWEERFFGSSYLFSVAYRRPLSAVSLQASRNVSSYPQQLASLAGGVANVALLDAIFQSRIPDPTERSQFIDQLVTSRGIPSTSSAALTLYTQQIVLLERQTANFALIGARNTVTLNLFRLRQQPLAATGAALPAAVLFNQNNTQLGGSLSVSHNLAPQLSLVGSMSYIDTEFEPPAAGKSSTFSLRAQVNERLSPKTSGFAGARYQVFRTDFTSSTFQTTAGTRANEVAIFAGIDHRF